YVAVAEEQGAARASLAGTTQNDILKEFLSRGTYVFPPEPSMRLTTDVVTWCVRETPKWNPINVCSYHLQEAGATPVQEVAFTLANAISVLDHVRASGQVSEDEIGAVVGRISFFCNAGIRFVEETAKMRAFTGLWDRVTRERYGVGDEKFRRFRYGVQVNSLGLSAVQPENNVYRILLEMLAVTLSKDARARAVQLPAWNEALGLPTAWDQQWSLRAQQVLAYETDLLEHPDLLEGSKVVEALTDEIAIGAEEELQRVLDRGGSAHALDYMKEQLVAANARRLREIEAGELEDVRRRVRAAAERLGARRIRMLVGKPGLDGHSNAAEQVAVRARDAGMEVVYQGIRLSPEEIARAAAEEDVHVVGLSVLS